VTPAALDPPDLSRRLRRALLVGVVGLAVWALGGATDAGGTARMHRAYLFGFVFWSGLGLGCLGLLMVQHVSGGAWGVMIRRTLEAGSRTVFYMPFLFLPIALFGVEDIYIWARADIVENDQILLQKARWLNPEGFLVRGLAYLMVWSVLAYYLSKWSGQQDVARREDVRLQKLSAIGLVIHVLLVTFMSVDWVMSLEPHWFSTIFGLLFVVNQGLAAFAFVIIVLASLSKAPPLAGLMKPVHFHDLGKFLFAFVMLWGYLSFSQFLIIYSGNLTEETPFYLHRTHGAWRALILFIVAFHFATPFLVLLFRSVKRNPATLAKVAMLLFFMRFVDLFWTMGPEIHAEHAVGFHWLDAIAPIGLGGLWMALFYWQLQSRPILPIGDPDLPKALRHHAH
jgi:hypothetical protein